MCVYIYICIYIYLYPTTRHQNGFMATDVLLRTPMGLSKGTSYHEAVVVMNGRACCIKIIHIHYVHSDLFGFEHSV